MNSTSNLEARPARSLERPVHWATEAQELFLLRRFSDREECEGRKEKDPRCQGAFILGTAVQTTEHAEYTENTSHSRETRFNQEERATFGGKCSLAASSVYSVYSVVSNGLFRSVAPGSFAFLAVFAVDSFGFGRTAVRAVSPRPTAPSRR